MGLIDFSLDNIGDLFKDIREAITGKAIEDPVKKAEIQLKLKSLEQAINLGQIKINQEEAKSNNWFIAGWRPALGWIGAISIGYQFIGLPILSWLSINFGWKEPPILDSTQLFNLVIAMLGFGGLRTYEKVRNVQNKH